MKKLKSLEPYFSDTWKKHKAVIIGCAAAAVALIACLILILCAPADTANAQAAEEAWGDMPVPGAEIYTQDPLAAGGTADAARTAADEEMTVRMQEIYDYLVQLDGMVTDNQTTLEEVRSRTDTDQSEEEAMTEAQEQLKGDVVNLGTRMESLHEEIKSTKELITLMKQTLEKSTGEDREAMEKSFRDIENSIRTLNSEYDSAISDVEKIIEKLRSEDKTRHQSVIDSLSDMKSAMEKTQREGLSGFSEELSKLRKTYTDSVTEIKGDLDAGFGSLSRDVAGNSRELTGVKEGLSSNSQELAGVKEGLNSNNQVLAGLRESLTGNTDRLQEIAEGLETGNGDLAAKLDTYQQWIESSFTSVSSGKSEVAGALLTKKIPVTTGAEDERVWRFSTMAGALRSMRSSGDDTLTWTAGEFPGGDNAPGIPDGEARSVQQSGYAADLGPGQQLTIPAGYIDRDVTVSNSVSLNGFLEYRPSGSELKELARGYYIGGIIDTTGVYSKGYQDGYNAGYDAGYAAGYADAQTGQSQLTATLLIHAAHTHCASCYTNAGYNYFQDGDDTDGDGNNDWTKYVYTCKSCGNSWSRTATSTTTSTSKAAAYAGYLAHLVDGHCPGAAVSCGVPDESLEDRTLNDASELIPGDRVIRMELIY